MIATAPGKLILAGEYAVLDGAPALVIAVNRRVAARRRPTPRGAAARGSSPFLVAVADELARRLGADHPAVQAAFEIVADSRACFDGATKLGLGSSAAVTVAATALALATGHEVLPVIDREAVEAVAGAAHATAQAARGARGSGADIAAAIHGGVLGFSTRKLDRLGWPSGVNLIPFFTGVPADTAELVARVQAARAANRVAVDAALTAIGEVSRAACQACSVRPPDVAASALLAAFALASRAVDQLAAATGISLVPSCVTAARAALAALGGTAKTTGAGGGDIAIAAIPSHHDVAAAIALVREAGGHPLALAIDPTGVDLQPDP